MEWKGAVDMTPNGWAKSPMCAQELETRQSEDFAQPEFARLPNQLSQLSLIFRSELDRVGTS